MTSDDVLARRYRLGPVIGRGGVADVHRATDLLLDREVAVKLLRDPATDSVDAARFAAEARTLAGLSHPALITVLDAGAHDDRPFLVMELVDGPTLHALMIRRTLAPARLAVIGAQVADALAHVHAQGVLHRDVKPGNVLVGAGDRVRLADFGIARLIGDTVRHTQPGHAVGTAAYLAPEQVLDTELTPAVDVYALGLVLLEALTGRRAFTGTPTEAVFARLLHSPDVPRSLPAPWRRLLDAMTAREAAHRPSAARCADQLRDLGRLHTAYVGDPTATVATAPPIRWATRRLDGRPPERVDPPAHVPGATRRALTLVAGGALLVLAAVLTGVTAAPGALGRPSVAVAAGPTTPASRTAADPPPEPSGPAAAAEPAADLSPTPVAVASTGVTGTTGAPSAGGAGHGKAKGKVRGKHHSKGKADHPTSKHAKNRRAAHGR